ncbi:BRCT domain-containing protein [Sporodiniella umbellata]|nr:BRCT domain-containing protein [Sporodiniella umbellata]
MQRLYFKRKQKRVIQRAFGHSSVGRNSCHERLCSPTLFSPKYYLPNQAHFFLSGIVLTLLDISPIDIGLITDQVKKRGGQIRNDLTEDVTHLICIDPRGAQYKHCMDHRIPVVLPHWLDDCLRWQERVDTRPYRFPEPWVQTMATVYPYPSLDTLPTVDKDVLRHQTIYFGQCVDLQHEFRSQLIQSVKRAGATVSVDYNGLVTLVILKYRSQEASRAWREQKTVASLWWLTNTLHRGQCLSPFRSLLDYPVPKAGIPGMECVSVTISGYQGVARDFLRRLVIHTGAVLNPLMDNHTTHLICGDSQSEKYRDAVRRGLQIVNHLWLEDCFSRWTPLSPQPRHRHLVSAPVAQSHLWPNKIELWMTPETTPATQQGKHAYQVIGLDEHGSVYIMKPRQAAVRAIRVLHSIVMPDVNAYEKESRLPSKKKQRT